jgi:tetratricopeptide (TPR) repeat protein
MMRRERAGEILWEFKHPLIQEVAYEAITRAKRRDYHRRIAEAIEATFPEGRPGRSGMLAYHFSLGRDLERAERYLFLAGEEAARLAASSEALDFLQEAAELFFQIHGEEGDPIRRARLEKLIALAFFKRGKMVEGNQHFDRALHGLGERLPSAGMGRNLHFASSLLRVLFDLHVPYHRRRPAATPLDQEVIDLMFFRAQAQVTADPAAYLIDSLTNNHRLNSVDPSTVEGAGGMYAGSVAYFAFTGMSFGLDRRLLRVAASLVNPDDAPESLMFGLMNFVSCVLRGDWDDRHVVDPALIEENLSLGALWNVINYLPLDAKRRVHQGRFAEAAEQLELITKIEDQYAYDLAKSNRLAVTMFMHLEKRQLEEALRTAETYYSSFDEDLLNLLGLGTKAKIEILMGRLEEAEGSLGRAEPIVQRTPFLPPFNVGAYWQSRFWLDLERLEGAIGGDRATISSLRRRARGSRRRALRNARHVAWQRPETLRLVGRYEWLRGSRRRALGWWGTTMVETETLGMRPEEARTLAEVGLRLRARGTGGLSFRGMTADECLARAEQLFEELGLSEERERLAAL